MAKLDWFNDDMSAYGKPLADKYGKLQAARKAQAEAIAKLPETVALRLAPLLWPGDCSKLACKPGHRIACRRSP